jgi:hypothetical protein
MSVTVSNNRIRATGSDANGLFIAFTSDKSLLKMDAEKIGSEEFQCMVKEALAARGYLTEGEGI